MLNDTLEKEKSLQYGPYVFGGDRIRRTCAVAMRNAQERALSEHSVRQAGHGPSPGPGHGPCHESGHVTGTSETHTHLATDANWGNDSGSWGGGSAERASEQARLEKCVTACAPWSRSAQRSCPSSRFPTAFTQAPGGCKPPDHPRRPDICCAWCAAEAVHARANACPQRTDSAASSAKATAQSNRAPPGGGGGGGAQARLPAAESLRKSEPPCT